MEISGIYKITNAITGDFYIGSSKDVKERWRNHKKPSKWKQYPNSPLYKDMQKYGTDKFILEIIEEIEPEQLKEKEQEFIEKLKPTYNNRRAEGWDFERLKESNRKYQKSDKGKESNRKASNKYYKSDKGKESKKKYNNQLCFYNGETLTLNALAHRFWRRGFTNPTIEAKKYLIKDK